MQLTTPTQTEFMEFRDGIYRSMPGWGKKDAALHYVVPPLHYGQAASFTYFRRSGGFIPLGNWKLFRMWPTVTGGKPNTYLGVPRVDDLKDYPWRLFTEDLLHTASGLHCFNDLAIPFADGLWHREEIDLVMPSGYAVADGRFVYKVDDAALINIVNFQCEGAGYKDPKTGLVPEFRGLPSWFCVQMCYQDNGTGPLPDTAYCHVAEPRIEIR